MEKINQIAKKYNLWVIEDCAQAHNAEFNGKKVGSFGVASCFSFYPSKNMTFCGDGGIVLTNDEKIAKTVQMLRDHGRADKYTNTLFGFNMRCNEIQAGIGRIQLKHLDEFTEKRIKNADLYRNKLKEIPIKLPEANTNGKHVYHIFAIESSKRDELQNFLKQEGIETGIQYPVPCHLQPAVTNKFGSVKLPHTEQSASTILSLPMFPELKEEEIDYVCDKIKEFYNGQ